MIEAMKQALDALEGMASDLGKFENEVPAIASVRQAIAEAEKQEPVAVVTGVYGGRFTYAPIKASVILPVGMALYTRPQHREWVDLTGEELETLLSKNSTLTLGAIWAVADKLKEKNNG